MERIAEKAGTGASGPDRPLAPLEEARLQLARLADDFASRQPLKPSRLHETRIRLKTIRYLAELAEESPERETFIDELKVVHDAVGECHDWDEASSLAEKRPSERGNSAQLREEAA